MQEGYHLKYHCLSVKETKNTRSNIKYCYHWVKINSTDETVVQCDVPVVKNSCFRWCWYTSSHKKIVLFLEPILRIDLVSSENEAHDLIQSILLVPEWLYWPYNSEGSTFYDKKYVKCYFPWNAEIRVLKLQVFFFSKYTFYLLWHLCLKLRLSCFHLKHISLSFNICSFQNGPNHPSSLTCFY